MLGFSNSCVLFFGRQALHMALLDRYPGCMLEYVIFCLINAQVHENLRWCKENHAHTPAVLRLGFINRKHKV
jgi:hypothetical protein